MPIKKRKVTECKKCGSTSGYYIKHLFTLNGKVCYDFDDKEVSNWVANYVIEKVNNAKPTKEKPFVLGLPTGSSPSGTYKRLIEFYKKGKISFKNIVTFNMDEYVNIPDDHPESYHYYMWHNFFNHIDIPKENVNILDGNSPDLEKECDDFETCTKLDFLKPIHEDANVKNLRKLKKQGIDKFLAGTRYY